MWAISAAIGAPAGTICHHSRHRTSVITGNIGAGDIGTGDIGTGPTNRLSWRSGNDRGYNQSKRHLWQPQRILCRTCAINAAKFAARTGNARWAQTVDPELASHRTNSAPCARTCKGVCPRSGAPTAQPANAPGCKDAHRGNQNACTRAACPTRPGETYGEIAHGQAACAHNVLTVNCAPAQYPRPTEPSPTKRREPTATTCTGVHGARKSASNSTHEGTGNTGPDQAGPAGSRARWRWSAP